MPSQIRKSMKTKLIPLMLCLLASIAAGAQTYTVNKVLHGSYLTNTNSEIFIDNKYGNIVIVPSANDSVIFDVNIEVTDKSPVDANIQLGNITVNFLSSGYFITALTAFNGSRNDFKTDWKMIAGSVFSSSKTVKVEYRVAVPEGLSLTIINSYGSIIMPDYSGVLKVNLTGGDFTASSLTGKTNLDLNGGKTRCRYLSDAMIIADMTEINLDSVGNAYFDTRGSQINIQKSGIISVDSRRDKWFIGHAVQISGSGNFSSFTVTQLQSDCNLKTFYGNLNIQNVMTGFHSINLISDNSDVSLGLPINETPSFQCDLKKSRSLFPARMNLKTETISEKDAIYRIHSTVENPSAFINMNVSGGSVSVY